MSISCAFRVHFGQKIPHFIPKYWNYSKILEFAKVKEIAQPRGLPWLSRFSKYGEGGIRTHLTSLILRGSGDPRVHFV